MRSLSQDAVMTKEKLNSDKHGMRIIGTADDSFNEKGIDLELKLLTKKYENETVINSREATDETSTIDETSINFKKKDTKLSLAKYYLNFFFQTWDRNGVPVKFCAVRYTLSTIDSEWLAKNQLEVITALAYYGFIVNTIASDGAPENRAANKKLVTLTA